jgi:hypothetical protein
MSKCTRAPNLEKSENSSIRTTLMAPQNSPAPPPFAASQAKLSCITMVVGGLVFETWDQFRPITSIVGAVS